MDPNTIKTSFNDNELRKIASAIKKKDLTENAAQKALTKALFSKLTQNGYLVITPPPKGKKAARASFAEDFERAFKQVDIPTPTRRSSNKSLSLVEVEKHILSLFNPRFEKIEAQLSELSASLSGGTPMTQKAPQSSQPPANFQSLLKDSYDRINDQDRRGGMVPLPPIWDELSKASISWDAFVKGLRDLERKRTIELQIASDRRNVKDADKAIDDPVRGLLYYLVWRR